ncbi:MAG: glycosyltransferase family 39 protein [Alphaproteobacteria bacterium]|nr:MAG: glycosyltransferase family 39 protein [Alphaproteobacteria bacterium]
MVRPTGHGYWGQSLARAVQFADRSPRAFLVLLSLLFFLPGITALPPLDRDESRYVQASKQMLETGDFVEIKFQDQGRNKKPVGVYWLQAASASLFGGAQKADIAAYRLPSLISAVLVVLFTHALAARALSARGALTAGALMSATLLLVGEANIAKTDAALLAAVTAAQFALWRAWHPGGPGNHGGAFSANGNAFLFWIALGIGTLIKGPVILMVIGLTVLTLILWERRATWLLALKPLVGFLLFLLIVVPWGIAVWSATDGAFFAEALGKDFGPKLVSGQESHGAPPGYFLMLVSATLWPAALLLWPSLTTVWSHRTAPLVRFVAAWALPSWLIFELVPTKLPHYILPIYPALILIIAFALEQWQRKHEKPNQIALWVSAALWTLVTTALLALIIKAPGEYGGAINGGLAAGVALIALCAMATLWSLWKTRWSATVIGCTLTGLLLTWTLLEGVAREIPDLFVSPKIAAAIAKAPPGSPLTSAGYTEPSLVFLTRTDILLGNGKAAATFLMENPSGLAIVEAREQDSFLSALAQKGQTAIPVERIRGTNYSKGQEVSLILYRLNAVRDR